MYATVRKYSGPAEFGEELVKRQDEVRRLIEGIPGFQAYYLLRTDEGGVLTVSVYDDRAGADESVRQAAEWIRATVPDLGVSPPEITTGEVGIHFGAGAPAARIA
jgi:heme-degrading monooxygenase HmoA